MPLSAYKAKPTWPFIISVLYQQNSEGSILCNSVCAYALTYPSFGYKTLSLDPPSFRTILKTRELNPLLSLRRHMANTLIGTWETTWDGSSREPHPDLTVTVTEAFRADPSGGILNGMYDLRNNQPGTMHGKFDAGIWKGTWQNSPTDKGHFTFKLGADDSFTGTYTFGERPEEFPWNSTRLKSRHTAVLAGE
jgi:hypothetical protein